jgi:hypothetical protein
MRLKVADPMRACALPPRASSGNLAQLLVEYRFAERAEDLAEPTCFDIATRISARVFARPAGLSRLLGRALAFRPITGEGWSRPRWALVCLCSRIERLRSATESERRGIRVAPVRARPVPVRLGGGRIGLARCVAFRPPRAAQTSAWLPSLISCGEGVRCQASGSRLMTRSAGFSVWP